MENEECVKRKKMFLVSEKGNIKIISKETMNDIDLLVSIHNSLVTFIFYFSFHTIK